MVYLIVFDCNTLYPIVFDCNTLFILTLVWKWKLKNLLWASHYTSLCFILRFFSFGFWTLNFSSSNTTFCVISTIDYIRYCSLLALSTLPLIISSWLIVLLIPSPYRLIFMCPADVPARSPPRPAANAAHSPEPDLATAPRTCHRIGCRPHRPPHFPNQPTSLPLESKAAPGP